MPENYVKNRNLHWSLDFKGCLSNGSIAELYGSVNFPQAQLLPSDPLSHDLSETHARWPWWLSWVMALAAKSGRKMESAPSSCSCVSACMHTSRVKTRLEKKQSLWG